MSKWNHDFSNVRELAMWLEGLCYFADSAAVVELIEKPQRFDVEYGVMQVWGQAQCPEFREHLVECLLEGEFDNQSPPITADLAHDVVNERNDLLAEVSDNVLVKPF